MTKDSLQADKGLMWKIAGYLAEDLPGTANALLEAMHDRDRFQRERDWEREQHGQA